MWTLHPRRLPDPIEAAAGASAVNRSCVSALAFLVYDILLSLGEEIDLIWSTPLRTMKFFFFFVRYVPVLVLVSILFNGTELSPQFNFTDRDCFVWQVYQSVATVMTAAAVDVILLLRLRALYFDAPIVRRLLLVAFGLEISGWCVGLALSVPNIQFDEKCIVHSLPATLLIYAASTIVFQALLFSFTAYKFIVGLKEGVSGDRIIVLLMRDGTWAFFLLFFMMVAEGALLTLADEHRSYTGVLFGWLLASFSYAGYRVLLNLNQAHRESLATSNSFTSLRFDDPRREISSDDVEQTT